MPPARHRDFSSKYLFHFINCKESLPCQCHATSLWKAKTRGKSKDRAKYPATRERSSFRRSNITLNFPRTHKPACHRASARSEEHTSELQSLMRISYAVFRLKKKTNN